MSAVSVTLSVFMRNVLSLVLPAGYSPASAQAAHRTLTISDYGLETQYSSSNTPEPVAVVVEDLTIGASATTVDLTSDASVIGAVDGNGDPAASEDLTGKKLMAIIVETPSTNAGDVTIKPAASNGYALFGGTNTQGVEFPPDCHASIIYADSSLPAVAAGAKDIVFDGTEDDVVNCILVFE